mgnify:CR=1 FL=1
MAHVTKYVIERMQQYFQSYPVDRWDTIGNKLKTKTKAKKNEQRELKGFLKHLTMKTNCKTGRDLRNLYSIPRHKRYLS